VSLFRYNPEIHDNPGDSPRNIISPARAAELAEHSFAKGYTRVYIIETRPTVKRNPPFR